MRQERILNALGQVDEAYILEAEPGRYPGRRRSGRMLAVLAACVGLLLALSTAAYAANWFGLRDLLLPLLTGGAEEGTAAISLAGYQGSPEWQALAEWNAFVADYDPDGEIYQETEGRLDASLARYSCYQVYSREMAGQMDAIAAKYGLKLHTALFDLHEHPELLDPLGDFLEGGGGYFDYMYEDGTFQMEGTMELGDAGAWDFQLLRSVRGTFHDAMLEIGDPSDYQERRCAAACGVTVTLALSPGRGLILAQLQDSFVTVLLPGGRDNGLRFSHLEELADRIDFSALAPAVEPQVAAGRPPVEVDGETRAVYAAALRNLLHSGILPDGTREQPGRTARFSVADVDGDGKEELVLLCAPGTQSGAAGYILGYDAESGQLVVELEEFPAFVFLENGNLKALASHNQTFGALWPYILYQYLPEYDCYREAGYVHAGDQRIFAESGAAEQYPGQADVSGAGRVYYIGTGGWGTAPVDEADYLAWLAEHQGDGPERAVDYVPLTEENILAMEG